MNYAPSTIAIILLAAGIGTVNGEEYGPWTGPQPVAAINTSAAEGCPIESPDGLDLYFASNRPGGQGKQDVWRARRPSVQDGWEAAGNLPAPVNSAEFDYCPTPLPGNSLLLVSSRQTDDDCFPGDTPPEPPPGGPSAGDIFLSHEDATNTWSTPVNLGCYPNGPNTAGAEFSPSLVTTPDGTFLYFSSNGYPDSQGQDIYVSRVAADGTVGPGERVAELSTTADDRMPNVRRDGLEIVFSSNRAGATPFDQDIYVATRVNTHSPWSAPVRIDNPAINTGGSETRASLSADGTRLYFGRKVDANDPGDVFVATRARIAAPAPADAVPAPTLGTPMLAFLAALLGGIAWWVRGAGVARIPRWYKHSPHCRRNAMKHRLLHLTACAFAAAFGASAQAATFTVGTPSGPGQPCTHGTIQSAIVAAETSPGADTIRLTRSLTYEPEANTINTSQELTIEGGYATCTQAAADDTKTVVSGAGGVHAPVFTITAPAGGLIHLRNLTISGGDVDGTGQGGGIRFSGNGILEIQRSAITNNIAGYGGGIYAAGTDSQAELVIGSDVVISNNTARYDGGGVYAEGLEMSMVNPGNSSILNNRAQGLSGDTGYGGGLYVTAQLLSGYAYIGSGAPVFGAIYGNHARYGGGVAVGGQSYNSRSKKAQLQLFTTRADYPAIIQNNDASVAGGGIHLRSGNSGDITASAELWNASLVGNSAPDGAAVMVTGSQSGAFSVNASILQRDDAIPCAVDAYCGRIEGNFTTDIASGAVIRSTLAGDVQLGGSLSPYETTVPRRGVLVRDNKGQYLINASGSGLVGLGDALVEGNQTSGVLINRSNGTFAVIDSTIAGNTIGGSSILSTSSSRVDLSHSILWQPGKTTLSRTGGTLGTQYLDASEAGSLGNPADPTGTTANPRFVDPAHGDYGLRAGSPVADYAPLNDFYTSVVDALGQPRNRDLPVKTKRFGVRDIGAFERQSLQPLVLNNNFDTDLRLWKVVTAGSTTRDATQNASGAANSGSAHVSATNLSISADRYGVSQCIHLPGPAIYALNGWGRGTGTQFSAGDYANLRWEYRRNGGEDCTGTPDAFGTLTLSNGPWRRPAEPARIEITAANWGDSPSITVILVATEFGGPGVGTDAWFDGITLDATSFNDVIFKNGFE